MKPKIYLAGAIQRSKDPYTWRFKIRDGLESDYDVIIPEDKLDLPPKFSLEDRQKAIYNDIIFRDIDYTVFCKEFFVKLDPDVFKGAGTVGEITFACYIHKPITCWFDGMTAQDVPGWVLGCLYGATMVGSAEEAIAHFRGKLGHYK